MVVRMRHNRSQTKQRRSHHALKAVTVSACSHCGAAHKPHHMCLECGYYNGRQVMDLEAEKQKRNARIAAKLERIKSEVASVTPAPETPATEEKAEDTASKKVKAKAVKRPKADEDQNN